MDDLVRWLSEQLDRDAARAEAARNAEFCKDGSWLVKGPFEEGLGSIHSEASEAILGEEESVPFALADHIAEHDPARVLREIDAKRQLLALHSTPTGHGCSTTDKTGYNLNYDEVSPEDACTTLRLLALPYSDRDGYRNEWRP